MSVRAYWAGWWTVARSGFRSWFKDLRGLRASGQAWSRSRFSGGFLQGDRWRPRPPWVLPEFLHYAMVQGEDRTFEIETDLGTYPPRPTDVLFLTDCTISMSAVIGRVKETAKDLLNQLLALDPDSRFGVASFDDYNFNDVPYRVHQDITADIDSVVRAIDAVELMTAAGDAAEAYSRALYEARSAQWRPGSRRIIVLFGDAPAKDPDFYGYNYGVDPGPGGPGAAPLRFRDVVEQVAADDIAVVVLHPPESPDNKFLLDAIKGFAYLADRTGGLTLPLGDLARVGQAILAGIRQVQSPRPRIQIPEPYREWLTLGQPIRMAPDQNRFRLTGTVCAPPGARMHPHHMILPVEALGHGGPPLYLGRTRILVDLADTAHLAPRLLGAAALPFALLASLATGRRGALPIRSPRSPGLHHFFKM